MNQYRISVFKYENNYPIHIKSSQTDPSSVYLPKIKTVLRKRITLKLADTIFESHVKFIWSDITFNKTLIREYAV